MSNLVDLCNWSELLDWVDFPSQSVFFNFCLQFSTVSTFLHLHLHLPSSPSPASTIYCKFLVARIHSVPLPHLKPRLHNPLQTSRFPDLFQAQAGLLDDPLEFLRGALDAVDRCHQADVAEVAVPRVVAVVCWEGGGGGREGGKAEGGVHDLVADEDAGLGGEGGAEGGEDVNAVDVGPVVSGWLGEEVSGGAFLF